MAQQIVNSYTEWDPLEEVVVGRLKAADFGYMPNDLFCGWEILEAPKPALPSDWSMYFCSPWVSMNVLSLDDQTVVVERQEEPLIKALRDWGFRCIPLDVRRRGVLRQFLN